jgi:DNA modification methylase
MSKLPINEVIQGDCLEVMRDWPDGCVDIIWTDPPYGNDNNNGDLISRIEEAAPSRRAKGDDGTWEYAPRPILNDSREDFERIVPGMLDQAARVLNRDSCCCCCCGGGGPVPLFAVVARWIDERLAFDQAVVWDKGGLGMGWRYRRNYEFVMVSHRKGGKMKRGVDWRDRRTANVVRIPKIIPRADQHPTPKPVELIEHFLRLHGKPGDLVVDPFCGHGPTLVAAKRLGMRYIGIELDPEYCAIARRRLAEIDGAIHDKQGRAIATCEPLFTLHDTLPNGEGGEGKESGNTRKTRIDSN